jgi:amidase
VIEKFILEEATIAELQNAMSSGLITSVELTSMYLNRIFYYDHNGLKLNSVPIINSLALEQAKEMDERRRQGNILGPLHGIPFTVKDSYMVKGLTVANGSPAFSHLTANEDSFIVEALKASGGVLIGKTNMPPMAAGGMQRGLYGRAESPYNANYLSAAWFSGSSNGSGVSTAANFAAFGMAEETVSSGRSPASNNGLVAYTPSRGLLSIRGNWPLFPTRDVVVPHTRTVDDLLILLDVIMVDDKKTDCDFWRTQQVVPLPTCEEFRPDEFSQLKDNTALKGKRIGVPKMYIGQDHENTPPITIRPSIACLWNQAAQDLKDLGADVVEVEFPLMRQYQEDPIFLSTFVNKGLLPEGWMSQEWDNLAPYALETFLQYVDDPNYPSFVDVDPDTVFPNPVGSVDARRGHQNARYRENIDVIKKGIRAPESLPSFREALTALENIRKECFETWLNESGLDMLIFPANCDIGQSNADYDEKAYDHAWQNGNFFSNTNHMLRHLGIPSVSVCMGIMEDTQMPVNLTLIGNAYSDKDLITCAYAYEQATKQRKAPPRTPPLDSDSFSKRTADLVNPLHRKGELPNLTMSNYQISGSWFEASGEFTKGNTIEIFINGINVPPIYQHNKWHIKVKVAKLYSVSHSLPTTLNILALTRDKMGIANASLIRVYTQTT